MDYSMRRPCADCPFLREGGIRLRAGRIRELAANMLAIDGGGTFTCHKTTVEADDEDGSRMDGPNAAHCAGALIFSEKQGVANQMTRISERLGIYDASKLDRDAFPLVFDDTQEMLKTAVDRKTKTTKTRTKESTR